jgi:hypothetical protein
MPTFEYPPGLSFNHAIYKHKEYQDLVSLRHHFFLTRLKQAVGHIAADTLTSEGRKGLKNAIVGDKFQNDSLQ